jgi:diguanylate cyclase (GGDEF)-like protein/PAS domain S-box-containing protein
MLKHPDHGTALDAMRYLINDEAKLVATPNFFEFGESDTQLMLELSDKLHDYREQFGATLHLALSGLPEVGEATLSTLAQRRSAYFSAVQGGWIDPLWVRNRILVRLNQYRIGLTPNWYFGVYRHFLLQVLSPIWQAYHDRSHHFQVCFQALAKVIWFDLAIAFEGFLEIDERSIAFREQIEETRLDLATPSATGKQYLQLLASDLAHALGVRYAMVARIARPEFDKADVLAMTDGGKPLAEFSYQLAGSPCRSVVDQNRCIYPSGVQQLFPDDAGLAELNVQGYAGIILHDMQGRPLGLLVVMHDAPFIDIDRIGHMLAAFSVRAATEIERLHTQLALQNSEARFRAAFNQAAVGICHTAADGHFILVNIKLCQILGYTEAELLSRNIDDITFPPDREKARNLISQLMEMPGSTVKQEKRYMRKDSAVIWVQATLSMAMKQDGKVDYLMAVVEDISDRKQLEYMLRLSNRALESSGNGVIITNAKDPNHAIIFANSAFCRISGYALEEVLGRNCRFLQCGDHEQAELKLIRSALHKQTEIHVVLRNYRKDGSLFWNDLSVSPVPDEYGNVTHFIGVINDITKQRSNQEQLAFRATHDELTGLPNRNLLNDRLPQALRQATRRKNSVALLFLDVDHFKLINDSIGHAAGDELLKGFADRLSSCVRAGDTVSRHGGDEFVLILKDIDKATHVVTVCENIYRSIAEPFVICGHKIHTTCSIGIALYPQDGGDAETLSKFADMALYRAKDLGRANFQFFSHEMNQRTLERVTLESALRTAIEYNQLYMNYQPLVDLHTGQVISLEALLRWSHPELGLVAPDRFISVAEESGLIGAIGEWVLRRACQDLRYWLDQGLPPIRVAVNVSPKQFRDAHLGDKIAAHLQEMAIPPRYLTLEITETVLMQDTASSEATLRQLKNLGVSLALDDFGTGYSSLSYLKRFPFDRVKIDRAFVRDIVNDTDDAALCKTIITMAHSLGIMVIAEGVESEEQCAFLRTNMCDEIQGYLFSRPLPASEIEALLREHRALPEHLLDHHQRQRCMLVVDAIPGGENMLALAQRFAGEDVRLLTARNGIQALAMLGQQVVDLVVLPTQMNDMDGHSLREQLKISFPGVESFILSA